jgi:hypothetical protein
MDKNENVPLSKTFISPDVDLIKQKEKEARESKEFKKKTYSRPTNIDQINKYLEYTGYDVRLKRVNTEVLMFTKTSVDGRNELVGHSLGHKRPTQLSMIQWITVIDKKLLEINKSLVK